MDRITTSKLLTIIRGARTFEEATAYHVSAEKPVFSELLFHLMQERGLSPKDMIQMTGIERSYFYHILNGRKSPGRNMVLRMGFCARVSLNEMNRLLTLANASVLYPKVRRDAILIFALQGRRTMESANDLLIQAGEEPLFLANKK
jgi:hypothetical protein